MFARSIHETAANSDKVFMTRKDLACIHEPFGDAFYYGYDQELLPEGDALT
jgi:hypothetical protein